MVETETASEIDLPNLLLSENEDRRAFYLKARETFAKVVSRAERVSVGSGGIPSQTAQHFWASILFTRLVVTAKSIQALAPDPKPKAHWDFSSVASMSRNLAECYLFYFFLCIDDVPQVEKDARIIMLNLHDDASRSKLFGELGKENSSAEKVKAHDAVRDDLLTKFKANAYLAALPEKRQKELIKGEKTPFVQDEVIDRTGMDKKEFRFWYRFFSNHTHTGPISFYRMAEHDRGRGYENPQDTIYIASAMEFAQLLMSRAVDDHHILFPGAEKRGANIKVAEVRRRAGSGRLKRR